MDLATLRKKIAEYDVFAEESNEALAEWEDILRYEADKESYDKLEEILGCKIELLGSERSSEDDHDTEYHRFKVDGHIYEVEGYYCSWDSGGIDDPMDFYEVELAEKTITYYRRKD